MDGTLAALADTVISLPPSASLAYMSSTSQTGIFPFIVAITGVNGAPDVDQTNDTMRSQFIVAPDWPDTIAIKMLTSNLAADGMNLNANPADANWYITNVFGDTIFSRTNTTDSTVYSDTVILPSLGYYKFTVSTPGFCAGLHWWAFDQQLTGYSPGYLLIKNLNGVKIPMHGYTYANSTSTGGLKNYGEHDDFGCGFSQYFFVSNANPSRVSNIKSPSSVAIYPNPANDMIYIDFDNVDISGGSISIINILGQTVYSASISSQNMKINSGSFSPGVYMILCNTANGSSNIGKVVVSH